MKQITLLIVLFVSLTTKLISQPCLPDGIVFSNQSMIDDFQINYPDCDIIEGKVRIDGNDISNLNGLSSITGIEGELEILDNSNLISLSGLSNLTYVGNDFWIEWNPLLTDFSGLSSLTSIGGGFWISSNNQLTNLMGLDSLSAIGFLDISSNENLTNLEGINSLLSVESDIVITQSNALVSLSGLENLTSNVTHLVLQNNPVLTDIKALQHISSISLFLAILDNNSLNNLSGLENISIDSLQRLWIYGNPQLSGCEILNICDFLSDSIGDVTIRENATGCNSQDEVITACYEGIQESVDSKMPIIYPNPVKDYLFIETHGSNIEETIVYNEFGQELDIRPNSSNSIDVSNLLSGIYILELKINGLRTRSTFLICK